MNENIVVIARPSSTLAQTLAHKLGSELLEYSFNTFSDAEKTVEIRNAEKLTGSNVILVEQFSYEETHSPINSQLFDLLLLINQIKQHNSNKIILFLPYLPYSRHDKNNIQNIPGQISFVASLLSQAGVDELVSADIHAPSIKSMLPFPLHHISCAPLWATVIKQHINEHNLNMHNMCLVSPDAGGKTRLEAIAQLIKGVTCATIEKERCGKDQTRVKKLYGDVEGQVVIMLDDIIDTGGTAINASQLLLESGARSIIGLFTHAVLSGGAQEQLIQSKFETIYVTNTIRLEHNTLPEPFKIVSIDHFLVNALSSQII